MEFGLNMRLKASGRDTTRIGDGRGRRNGRVKIVKGGLGIAVSERRWVWCTKVCDTVSNVGECLSGFIVLEKGTELEPATDELFGVKQGFGGGGEIWKMDGITGVVSACFGFEGAARMEVPFRINVLRMPCLGFTIESGRNKVALASWRIQGRVRTRLVVSGGGECGLVGRMDPSRTSTMSPVERI